MLSTFSIAGLGTLAIVAALATTQLSTPPQPTRPDGHLVLIVGGNANALEITHVVAKRDPCGPTDTIDSEYHIVMLDRDQHEIARYPLDLSQFDLNRKHVGRALHVEGCAVVDTKVATLCNVPYHPNATKIVIEGPDLILGGLNREAYTKLVSAAITARGQR